MRSKKIFKIILATFLCLLSGLVIAQTTPKSAEKAKSENKKTAEKIVLVKERTYSDSDIVLDMGDDVKVNLQENPNEIVVMPEIKAEYPDGSEAFIKYIFAHYQSPTKEEINAKAYVSFVIEKDGTLSDIKVLRDPGYGIGNEILRIIKKSPKWNPAINNGRVVRSQYTFPISIKQN